MVVDVQGSYDDDTDSFVLSDPSVLCSNTARFGRSNVGVEGVARFFESHVCNECCLELGLAAVRPVEGDC